MGPERARPAGGGVDCDWTPANGTLKTCPDLKSNTSGTTPTALKFLSCCNKTFTFWCCPVDRELTWRGGLPAILLIAPLGCATDCAHDPGRVHPATRRI